MDIVIKHRCFYENGHRRTPHKSRNHDFSKCLATSDILRFHISALIAWTFRDAFLNRHCFVQLLLLWRVWFDDLFYFTIFFIWQFVLFFHNLLNCPVMLWWYWIKEYMCISGNIITCVVQTQTLYFPNHMIIIQGNTRIYINELTNNNNRVNMWFC